jgi:hypothetical protein
MGRRRPHGAPGTVTAGEDGRLVVTATHTFAAEFHGNATVHLGISEAEATWPVSVNVRAEPAEASAPSYEFRGQQILAAIPNVRGSTTYEIIFHLDMPLPTRKSGGPEASLGGGIAGSISSFDPHKGSACYTARLAATVKGRLKSRHSLPFSLKIQQPPSLIQGKAVLRRYASLKRMHSAASRQLGCG